MILLVGATGSLGGLVTRLLLARGQHARLLVRDPSSAEPLVRAGASPVYGDLKDPRSLVDAVAGVKTVVTTANSALRGGADTIDTVDRDGNRNLIDAARAAGVQHFIFVSARDSRLDSPVPFVRAKAETEAYLRRSGIPFTIVAPNVFMEVWVPLVVGARIRAGEPVILVGEARHRHSFVSARDVAAFVAASVDRGEAANRYLPVGGPEPISWRDVVAAYERVLGRGIPVQFVAPGDPAVGLPDPLPGLLASLETYDSPMDMTELAREFEVTLTPLDTVVREDVAASVPPVSERHADRVRLRPQE